MKKMKNAKRHTLSKSKEEKLNGDKTSRNTNTL